MQIKLNQTFTMILIINEMIFLQLKGFERNQEKNQLLLIKTKMKDKLIKQAKKVTLVVLALKIFKTIQQNFFKRNLIAVMKYLILMTNKKIRMMELFNFLIECLHLQQLHLKMKLKVNLLLRHNYMMYLKDKLDSSLMKTYFQENNLWMTLVK